MYNECIFLLQTIFICSSALIALKLGEQALVALICVATLLANLFVLKQIPLFGLTVTATDAYSIGVMFSFNMLQEYFGKKAAQKALWISMSMFGAYAVLSLLHLAYQPSVADTMHSYYAAILPAMPRLLFASLTAYTISIRFDRFLYGILQRKTAGKHFVLRNYASLLISQLLDTALFSLLGLYGTVTHIGHIILVSYSIKITSIAFTTPFLVLAKKIR